MNIEIVQVTPKAAFTKKNEPYNQLQVIYKSDRGNISQKTLIPFGTGKPVYEVIAGAKAGDFFTVTAVKNGQYSEWTEIARQDAPPPQAVGSVPAKGFAAPVRSNYETPEERAARQVYIVRQSSIGAAIELMKLNQPKGGVTQDDVLKIAAGFEAWVFNKPNAPETSNDLFEDLKDDIPF